MRHTYSQYGHLPAGQTWTILTELKAINYMIDFAYGDAIFGGRVVQVRWEQPFNEQRSWIRPTLDNLNDSDEKFSVIVLFSKQYW